MCELKPFKPLFVYLWVVYIIITSGSETTISISGKNFYINNKKTYSSSTFPHVPGLLINSRMINAIFNNSNTEYNYLFEYPDTGKWDPIRNVNEFIGNLSLYKSYGLLSFTVGLQGGNPFGYEYNEPDDISGQPWVVSAYDEETGELDLSFFDRLELILHETDKLGMIPIVQMFYASQVNKMKDKTTIFSAINNTLDWLMSTNYTNFMIELANECTYINNDILNPNGIAATIDYVRDYTKGKYLLSTSLGPGYVPQDDIIGASDYILLHGNGQTADSVVNMINQVKNNDEYNRNKKPIMFNEDDHYDWTSNGTYSNFYAAINNHVSWGVFFDCNQSTAGDYIHGYQCLPAAWDINTQKKQEFFNVAKVYTSL